MVKLRPLCQPRDALAMLSGSNARLLTRKSFTNFLRMGTLCVIKLRCFFKFYLHVNQAMNNTNRGYNNLPEAVSSLPAKAYYENEILDQELASIWHKSWVYAGRASQWAKPGDYRTLQIGSQNIILVKTEENRINAFYNTCRHRGSVLCLHDAGSFNSGDISCPYHHWTYSLAGDLIRTPNIPELPNFDKSDYPLYPVSVAFWGGCVFVNLSGSDDESTLDSGFEPSADHLQNWSLDELNIVHTYEVRLHCNWEISWDEEVYLSWDLSSSIVLTE